jgi:putative tricarboxylic transport membrane protein
LPLVWLSLGLLLSLVLFELVGFVLSSSVLFWMVARSFRSERPIRDAGVALALSTLIYFTFTRGLGLVLPTGVLGWSF